ncbi:MAG TPA: hypothetical protein VFW44_14440 [Bryobacteraceae bacterium]|nr:hypothetical protein [Bryobacteraceae bacterium]
MVLAAGLTSIAGLYFGLTRVRRPPTPAPAALPASARALLKPFRKDMVEVTVPSQADRNYEVGMQAGATLVYSWSTGSRGETVACQFAGRESAGISEAHSAFVAQSAGWYRWRWRNQNRRPVTIHLKLSGFYEPGILPPEGVQ